jgi:sensor histidine kinase YesM
MMDKELFKRLCLISISFSVILAVLALGIIVASQVYFPGLLRFPNILLGDFLLALVFAFVVYTISMGYVFFVKYFARKCDNQFKIGIRAFRINILLSLIPFLIGGKALDLVSRSIFTQSVSIDLLRFNYPTSYILLIILIGAFFFGNLIVYMIMNYVILIHNKAKLELENTQLKMKNMEAAYLQLKNQIQPHFLFNALNTLKSLIKKQPAAAEEYLKHLSDLLRRTISQDQESTVSLADEIQLCTDYIELQKTRFGESLKFSSDIPKNIKGFLPGFAIQQLLENAIKHNAFTTENPLFIDISYSNGTIIIRNNKQKKILSEESIGTGLMNLSERYKIISGDDIIINDSDDSFSVTIKILDNENSNH